MIVLDTDVLSELMRSSPDPTIVAWLDRRPPSSVWTTSATLFEIAAGIEFLPAGRRANVMRDDLEKLVGDVLGRRVLDFDVSAARAAALVAARLRSAGIRGELADVQIAGIAVARKASVATRNARHFEGAGVDVVDPWKDE